MFYLYFSRCDIPEEPEDEDEALSGATYKYNLSTFDYLQRLHDFFTLWCVMEPQSL
jgi:hypothetical protein